MDLGRATQHISKRRRYRRAKFDLETRAGPDGPSRCVADDPANHHAARFGGYRARSPSGSRRIGRVLRHLQPTSNRRHEGRPCHRQIYAARTRRSCRAGTSGEISGPSDITSGRRIEVDLRKSFHGQGIDDVSTLAGDAVIFIDAEQHVSGLPAIGDENRPVRRGLLGSPGILIELSAGERGDRQDIAPSSTYQHYYIMVRRTTA